MCNNSCKLKNVQIAVSQPIGYMKAHRYIQTHAITIAGGYSCAPNLWAHGGKWVHTYTGVCSGQQVLEIISMTQKIGHMGAFGHIVTHELIMNNQYWWLQLCLKPGNQANRHIHTHEFTMDIKVLEVLALTQPISRMGAHGHIQTHKYTMNNQSQKL